MIYKRLTDFSLTANNRYVPLYTQTMETGTVLSGIFDAIPVKVPGSIYSDLHRAGIIKDPFFEMQSLDCEWVANRWWTYQTAFTVDYNKKGRNFLLRLCGIDYKARIYLNNNLLGEHEGMYTPFVENITDLIFFEGENILSVVFEHAPDEMGQIGYTSRTHTQKARFPYRWDFCTRMVQIGLYDDVLLEDIGCASIDYADIQTRLDKKDCEMNCFFEITGYEKCKAQLNCMVTFDNEVVSDFNSTIDIDLGKNMVTSNLQIPDVKLWWPNGHGVQHLYEVQVKITGENGISDLKSYTVGVRELEYIRCENAPLDSFPYTIVINKKPIYIKGVNMTPLSINYGSVTDTLREEMLSLVKNANINLIRVWGGGIIEHHYFYELCDRFGIMVWQDFIQSSSGIDNKPSQITHFIKLLKESAIEAVKSRRTHVSLSFWCGGNELMEKDNTPSDFADSNIAELKQITDMYDPLRQMLPTTASGPVEFLDINKPGKNYDVHGPWMYEGVEKHYFIFNNSDSLLHSEFGVNGMTNKGSLEKILSHEQLKVYKMSENSVWRFRGEMWDTVERDSDLFGAFLPEDIDNFIKCSQYIQYEGLRYAVMANRKRAFRNCGSIIWQFNEPMPNISCTNLVDYYLKPKLAYYAVKNSYSTLAVGLKYDKLVWATGETINASLFIVNDLEECVGELVLEVYDDNNNPLQSYEKSVLVKGNGTTEMFNVIIPVLEFSAVYFNIKFKYNHSDFEETYIMFVKNKNGFCDRNIVLKQYEKIAEMNK